MKRDVPPQGQEPGLGSPTPRAQAWADTRGAAVRREDGRPANPQDVPTEAPARRSGRQCGYEHRDQLITATRALGAALTQLARDADPDARQAGAALALEVAEYVRAAVVRADESSGRARRAAAEVERQLPRLNRQLDQLRTRLHPDLQGVRKP